MNTCLEQQGRETEPAFAWGPMTLLAKDFPENQTCWKGREPRVVGRGALALGASATIKVSPEQRVLSGSHYIYDSISTGRAGGKGPRSLSEISHPGRWERVSGKLNNQHN